MSGEDFQEEAVLAAVKPLKDVGLTESAPRDEVPAGRNSMSGSATADQSPLEILFRQHSDRVFRTANRVTGSAADAEDVLQTVFLRLARGPEPLSGLENPEGYFARAAINASLDLLRSRKRSRAVAFDDCEAGAVVASFASARNPEAGHEDRELRNLIRAAVSRLGTSAAQMFTLRYFEGYDNGEIARIMSTSALVVGVTLHRARAKLRKEIGSYLQQHSSA
jgi:RNA polymerase sigma-70 factor, ECF subfamily